MLYLCATPIGNLEDITLRVSRILSEADIIAAEDTRRTLKLLNHLGLKKQLISCHEHNQRERAVELIRMVQEGKTVAVVSDAGMPGISDPGSAIVKAAIEAGVEFTVLPGASAVLTAVVFSGLDCGRFVFEGFLPREKKQRMERIASLLREPRTAVIYESPYRLRDTLLELLKNLGDRPAAVCRELTKIYEETVRGTLSTLLEHYTEAPKGECAIVLGGAVIAKEEPSLSVLLATMLKGIGEGMRPKDAAKAAAGKNANALYQEYLKQKG